MWNTLVEYLQYPFVRRILVAGCLLCIHAWRDTCVKTLFLYWRRTVPCGICCDGNRDGAADDEQYTYNIADHGCGSNPDAEDWTECEDQRRCRDCDAFRWIAGIWISDHECIRNIAECIRGCVLDTVWRGIHTHIIEYRCVDLPDYVAVGTCVLHLVLSQDLLGDI